MHGLILMELRKFVTTGFGNSTWMELLTTTGLENKRFLPTDTCLDSEVVALVTAASQKLGKPAEAILESFGEFLVPDLVRLYSAFIRTEWKTMDLLANTETIIHKAVRAHSPDATPPRLVCQRPEPNEVLIVYTSPRKLCALARGLLNGIARHYNERIVVSDRGCMLLGDPECRLSVSLAA